MDEVHSGRGYQSHWGTRLHFGLAKHERADRIEVHWPRSGVVDILEDVQADRMLTIVEGSSPSKTQTLVQVSRGSETIAWGTEKLTVDRAVRRARRLARNHPMNKLTSWMRLGSTRVWLLPLALVCAAAIVISGWMIGSLRKDKAAGEAASRTKEPASGARANLDASPPPFLRRLARWQRQERKSRRPSRRNRWKSPST